MSVFQWRLFGQSYFHMSPKSRDMLPFVTVTISLTSSWKSIPLKATAKTCESQIPNHRSLVATSSPSFCSRHSDAFAKATVGLLRRHPTSFNGFEFSSEFPFDDLDNKILLLNLWRSSNHNTFECLFSPSFLFCTVRGRSLWCRSLWYMTFHSCPAIPLNIVWQKACPRRLAGIPIDDSPHWWRRRRCALLLLHALVVWAHPAPLGWLLLEILS